MTIWFIIYNMVYELLLLVERNKRRKNDDWNGEDIKKHITCKKCVLYSKNLVIKICLDHLESSLQLSFFGIFGLNSKLFIFLLDLTKGSNESVAIL